jgi:CubicO group peptidase (beta-lactamase class C family)
MDRICVQHDECGITTVPTSTATTRSRPSSGSLSRIAGIVRGLAGSAVLIATGASAQIQQVPQNVPGPRESDPVAMGWMRSSPPPPEKQIKFEDGSYARFPQSRWAFSHFREFFPTARVSRGKGPVAVLPLKLRNDLDDVTFVPIGSQQPMTWALAFEAVYGDAVIVLHRGRVVYERYAGVTNGDTPHIAYSVSKSFSGTLAEMLIAEGRLDENALVARYIPEFAGSGFGDATVRQVLDMTTGIDYSENYLDPKAQVVNYAWAAGAAPRPAGYAGPKNVFDFLKTIPKLGSHGGQFTYRTVNTEVVAILVQRVTNTPLPALLSERIWSKLGAEQDADFVVDSNGAAIAGGGLNMTLRDAARFGEMLRLNGRFNGQQIVSAAALASIRRGGSQADFAKAGYATLPNWSYRSQWWVSHNRDGAFTARGIHGQVIYIDPKAEMVIARFASNPKASNVNFDPISLPAYQAIADRLVQPEKRR